MKGTVRTLDAKVRDFVEARMARSSSHGTALALGARPKCIISAAIRSR
jgi:hypothetical protein